MDASSFGIYLGLSVALVLLIQPFVAAQPISQEINKNLSQSEDSQNTNNTRAIVNLKNHTITLIDSTTNETISVKNFTLKAGNNTTNKAGVSENFSGKGNMLTSELKNTTNATENGLGSINLTEKFTDLTK